MPWKTTDAGGRRIHVLFVMIQMAMGGTERLVLDLVRNLDRARFAPSVAWFLQEQPLTEFAELGIPLHYIPKRRRFDWTAMRQVARIVRERQIDVINAHHFMSFFYACYGARIAGRAGLVYTEHSEADVLNATGKWRAIGSQLLRRSDAVVGISEAVSARLSSHFDVDPRLVHTIENGVDVDLFDKADQNRDDMRAQAGLGPHDVVIGEVANFRRNKNHLFLLRAFREVVRSRPSARLVFVGQGFAGDPENSEPEIRAFIRENGLQDRVTLMGYRPDVPALLPAMDVSCLVSYKEGLPLSLIEAMASGLPVVGTDVEGIRDVIQPDVNGMLVRPDDVSGLARALRRLIEDQPVRHRMASAARTTARERYHLRRCVGQTEELLSCVATRAAR